MLTNSATHFSFTSLSDKGVNSVFSIASFICQLDSSMIEKFNVDIDDTFHAQYHPELPQFYKDLIAAIGPNNFKREECEQNMTAFSEKYKSRLSEYLTFRHFLNEASQNTYLSQSFPTFFNGFKLDLTGCSENRDKCGLNNIEKFYQYMRKNMKDIPRMDNLVESASLTHVAINTDRFLFSATNEALEKVISEIFANGKSADSNVADFDITKISEEQLEGVGHLISTVHPDYVSGEELNVIKQMTTQNNMSTIKDFAKKFLHNILNTESNFGNDSDQSTQILKQTAKKIVESQICVTDFFLAPVNDEFVDDIEMLFGESIVYKQFKKDMQVNLPLMNPRTCQQQISNHIKSIIHSMQESVSREKIRKMNDEIVTSRRLTEDEEEEEDHEETQEEKEAREKEEKEKQERERTQDKAIYESVYKRIDSIKSVEPKFFVIEEQQNNDPNSGTEPNSQDKSTNSDSWVHPIGSFIATGAFVAAMRI